MKNYNLVFLFALFFVLSCTKEGFVVHDETPVFSMEAQLNEESVFLQAGIDDYYMFTDFYPENVNASPDEMKWINEGHLTLENNPLVSFKWKLRNIALPRDMLFSEPLELDFYESNYISEGLRLAPQLNGQTTGVSMHWKIGDNLESDELNPTIPYDLLINGPVKVTANFNIPGALNYSMDGYVGTAGFCGSNFKLQRRLDLDRYVLSINHFNNTAAEVTWNNGETGNRILKEITTHSFSGKIKGNEESCDQSFEGEIFADNISLIKIGFLPEYPAANILSAEPEIDRNTSIEFEYTNKDGDVFSSIGLKQDTSSYFEILEVSNYELNENGQNTILIRSQFSLKMLDDSKQKVIEVNDAVATFAVAVQ